MNATWDSYTDQLINTITEAVVRSEKALDAYVIEIERRRKAYWSRPFYKRWLSTKMEPGFHYHERWQRSSLSWQVEKNKALLGNVLWLLDHGATSITLTDEEINRIIPH